MEVIGFLNRNSLSAVLGMRAGTGLVQETVGGERLGTVSLGSSFTICKLEKGKGIIAVGRCRVKVFFP